MPFAIVVTGLIFIFLIPSENILLRFIFKLVPMLLIIFYGYLQIRSIPSTYQKLIIFGLICCTLGDAFIIFSFIFGLVAFLIGHLFYISAFIRKWKINWIKSLALIPIVLYALFFGYQLVTALSQSERSELIIPVICYITVISIMGLAAMMTGEKTAILGSALFIISDTILSWNMFISNIAYSDHWIMLTYYNAQFLIALTIADKSTNTYIKPANYRL